MPYKITVTRTVLAPSPISGGTDITTGLTEVFSQELPDTFDLSKFARELNRPTRKRRTTKEVAAK